MMSETGACPNDGFVKDVFSYNIKLRDIIVPGLDPAIEVAADANTLAIKDPLRALDISMSPEEITDIAVMWAAYADRIKEFTDRGENIIYSPCPGAQKCAKMCVKMAISMEAAEISREMAKPFMKDQ